MSSFYGISNADLKEEQELSGGWILQQINEDLVFHCWAVPSVWKSFLSPGLCIAACFIQFSSYCQLLTGPSPVIQPAGTSQLSLPHHPTLILSVARLTIWCGSCLQSLFLPTVQELCPAQGSILFGGWVFIGRTDAEAETPILWPPHAKSWLIGKDPNAGKDWGQEEKGTTEDEMFGWHHWLDGHEFG